MPLNRRDFVRSSLAAGSLSGCPALALGRETKTYRTALVGARPQATPLLAEAARSGRLSIVGLCERRYGRSGPLLKNIAQVTGEQPRWFADFADLLAETRPEIVVVAAGAHQSAQAAVAALHSGAHVYVELPVARSLNELRAITDVARAANRIVQVGMPWRMSSPFRTAIAFLKSGQAGQIRQVRACLECSPSPERLTDPRFGPAGKFEFSAAGRRVAAGADCGELASIPVAYWAIQWLDHVLEWTDESSPRAISSFQYDCDRPDCRHCRSVQGNRFAFEGFTFDWEVRELPEDATRTYGSRLYFYGTRGTVCIDPLDGWCFYPRDSREPVRRERGALEPGNRRNLGKLWTDFLSAIETGRPAACGIESCLFPIQVKLLGSLAFEEGGRVVCNTIDEALIGDAQASLKLAAR